MSPLHTARRFAASLAGIACVLAAQSCGSNSTTTTTGGTITLTLSGTSATVAPGAQAVVVGTIARGGGFDGDVVISVTGQPTGVTGSVGTVSTIGTTSTATVTILVASTAAAGTYPLTVTASGSGVSSVTATYTLTISAAAQSYTLSLAPTGTTIAAGASGTIAVTINRSGFAGAVTLAVPNLPTGLTASFSPNSTTTNSSTLTITVGSTVAAGLYQLTVSGTATGQTDQLTFATVTVPATGSYSLSVSPTTVNVVQGSSNTATVTIARSGGFAGNVGFTIAGNPALLSGAFAPALVSGTSSTLTFSAVSTLPVGSYPVVIHGSAAGFTSDQTVNVTVNVTSAGGGSANAVLNFAACTASAQPVWLAFQDGTGAWSVVTANNNVYQFSVTQSTVGVAYVMHSSVTTTQTTILYYTKSELTSVPIVFCPAPGTNTMNGSLAGLGANDQAAVSLAASVAVTSLPATTFQLTKMPAGTFDLIGYRSAILAPSTSDRLIIRRDQLVQNAGTIPLLDFGSSEAVAPASATITVAGGGGGQATAQMTYFSTNCTSSGLLYFLLNPVSPFSVFGIPAASQRATDFHSLLVGVSTASGTVGAQEFFHTLANRTIMMPTALATPAIASLTGNYKRLQATYTVPAEYTGATSFLYFDAQSAHGVSMTATAGYLGGSSAVLALPVFSGLTGFLDSWEPATGTTVSWTVTANGGTNSTPLCQEGARLVSATVNGSN